MMINHYRHFYVMTRSLVVNVFLLVVLSEVDGAVITESPPQLVTVSPFGMATFKYEGNGNELNLLVQGAPLTPEVKQQRSITVTGPGGPGNLSSELSIVGLPVNDGIGISCFVQSYPPLEQAFSLGTTLRLKGVSPVGDLIHNFPKDNLLLITWSPPVYYSNDVLPNLFYYQVLVIDEEDGDIILDTTTSNTNITVYNITQCDTFNISITASFALYISIDNTISNNGSYSIAEYDTQPLIPSISFQLGCPPSKCLVSLMDLNTEVTDIISETEHIIEFKLLPFRHYELTAVVKSLRGKTKAIYGTSISTFHTQDIIISSPYTDGSVSVQCVFVSGSTADGCHVIFNDTDQEIAQSFNITGSGSAIVTVSASGFYDVYVYDIVNGSLYGPAVQDTILVEVIKVISSTSTSSNIMSEGITATTKSTVSNTVGPSTTISATVTGTTSSTSKTTNDNDIIVPTVAGTVSVIVLMILVIITVCAVITVNKSKKMKRVLIRSENATIQQPQAKTNQYQDVQELRNEGPNNNRLAVQLTYSRPIDEEENPYHVNRNEFVPDNRTFEEPITQWEQRPSLISTATQDTILEDSISSTTLNNHDNAYTTDTAVTVNVSNGTVSVTVTNTAATVAPTYASITKRTDTTVPPAIDQRVEYDTVTGDINKRGGDVIVYPPDDISANPPPPSYAATIAQESGATVSSSQFKVPEQVTGAAVVHGQYGKYPQTENDYDISTPVQAETCTTDENEIIVQPSAASVPSNKDEADARKAMRSPMNVDQILLAHFQENEWHHWHVSIKMPCPAYDEYTANEIFGFLKSENVEEVQEVGTLVLGITLNTELHVHLQRKTKIKKFRSHNIFEGDSNSDNHEIVVAAPTFHTEVI